MGLLKFTPAAWSAVEAVLGTLDAPTADRLDMTGLLRRLLADKMISIARLAPMANGAKSTIPRTWRCTRRWCEGRAPARGLPVGRRQIEARRFYGVSRRLCQVSTRLCAASRHRDPGFCWRDPGQRRCGRRRRRHRHLDTHPCRPWSALYRCGGAERRDARTRYRKFVRHRYHLGQRFSGGNRIAGQLRRSCQYGLVVPLGGLRSGVRRISIAFCARAVSLSPSGIRASSKQTHCSRRSRRRSRGLNPTYSGSHQAAPASPSS